ncbi:MAG: shikimate kinase [Epulopiscium sp.]|jgi:shikimate kinase|uniref:Shikimate kinase n=1 Tax=Defluviitalea raffinosedens TaxID=1450156 RepID=A0A7C8LKI0_9FIRM|nr:shikimate kinase [Defluviitalea raffinosedens]MBZ4668041.1 shikimate kinase [Defluviitaleaceae bacterium]MDK2788551.1 shikimate kinase [Candidatus Epulonipiscium sp.]KAE9633774.1 shikimate kinase [Defluviitalea raffinosedens]MBM7686119.1 shikimate kinase [Defluviitalea raffinosedens]HHW68548.1 shikimate kinase [Candidatus Epulonipiscium sp.]
MKNIVLIGMPGAGKSTIGVVLAKTLKMPFIDTDILIQQKQNRLLQEIIEEDGIEEFLSIEEQVILDLDVWGSVISTGGSVVLESDGMRHLKENGFVVYLQLPYKEIEKRIRDITTRGIVMQKGQSLLQVYDERVPLYEKYADAMIRCMGKNMEQIIKELKELWEGIR